MLFGVYAWGALLLIALPCTAVIAILRHSASRWRLVWRAGRCFLVIVPVPVSVRGQLPGRRPLVLVCNHSSMVDGLAMVLALPGPQAFVVTGRFESVPLLGALLRRLGAVFVHRTPDAATSGAHADVDRLAAGLTDDALLVVFPEGSLGAHPGIRPFHHGAFLAAARSGTPVVPVAIRGARDLLPPGGRLPRRAPVEVVVGTPIDPPAEEWGEVVAFGERARAAVAALVPEPEIGSDPYRS